MASAGWWWSGGEGGNVHSPSCGPNLSRSLHPLVMSTCADTSKLARMERWCLLLVDRLQWCQSEGPIARSGSHSANPLVLHSRSNVAIESSDVKSGFRAGTVSASVSSLANVCRGPIDPTADTKPCVGFIGGCGVDSLGQSIWKQILFGLLLDQL